MTPLGPPPGWPDWEFLRAALAAACPRCAAPLLLLLAACLAADALRPRLPPVFKDECPEGW